MSNSHSIPTYQIFQRKEKVEIAAKMAQVEIKPDNSLYNTIANNDISKYKIEKPNYHPSHSVWTGGQVAEENKLILIAQAYAISYHSGREEHILTHKLSNRRGEVEILYGSQDRSDVVAFYQATLEQVIKKAEVSNQRQRQYKV